MVDGVSLKDYGDGVSHLGLTHWAAEEGANNLPPRLADGSTAPRLSLQPPRPSPFNKDLFYGFITTKLGALFREEGSSLSREVLSDQIHTFVE